MATKARRPKGTGTLWHLEGDRWRLMLNAGGKRPSRVFRARNLTEANRAADAIRLELLARHEQGASTRGHEREQRRTWTVERYIEHYFESWAPYHLAATTRQRYRGIADRQIIPYIGKLRMSEVTASKLTEMYSALAGKGARSRGGDGGLSPATVWTVHSVVRALFTFAVEVEEDFEKNPAKSKAARPNVKRTTKRARALDVAEVERFIDLIREQAPEYAVPVMLSAYLGTRRGETLGLRWADVDFERGTVTVQRSVSQTKAEGVTVKSTKTDKARAIPLDAHTLSELRAIQREQRKLRVRLGRGWDGAKSPDEDYIATTPTGALVTPETFSNAFRTVAERNKLARVTPHILRHSFVSQMIDLGFDAVTIASMTGHSPDVLLNTYAHAFDARKREAVDALGQARNEARAAK